jgi:hypothetical protein
MLTKTEDFADAAWTKLQVTPSGSRITTTASSGNRNIRQDMANIVPGNIIFSVEFKPGTATDVSVRFLGSVDLNARFNLATGTVIAGPGTIKATTDGYYLCTVSGANTATSAGAYIYINDVVVGAYADIRKPDSRPANAGSRLPPYQKVNTITDYDPVGFPVRLQQNLAGTASMVTASTIDCTNTNKMTVFAGVRKLSDASAQSLIQFGTISLSPGSFELLANNAGAVQAYSGGSTPAYGVLSIVSSPNFIAPTSFVATVKANIGAPSLYFSIKNQGYSLSGTSVQSQGTGNYGNRSMYIGARADGSLSFIGYIYQSLGCGTLLSDYATKRIEQWTAYKMGITL